MPVPLYIGLKADIFNRNEYIIEYRLKLHLFSH